jgi:VWFA-related protein
MSNPISKSRGTFALAALLLTTALLTNAQAPSPPTLPQSTAPTLHVYSRETIIDVLVTDDKGQPVRGLKQSDFTVEEDSKPQPIRSFAEYDKATPPPPPHTLPPNTYNNSTALPANGPVQIFLFDRVASAPADLQRSKPFIASYFRTMPAGTTVAILNLSPTKGLRLIQGLTSDGSSAASAVENLDVEWLPEPGAGLPDAIAAANQIAAYVAGVKGRKNLMWILQGSPPLIVHDGGLSWGMTDMTLVHRLMDLYDIFTREQIAISPLDSRGVHEINTMAELKWVDVTDQTGGTFTNSNDYKGTIANIVDGTLDGYTLSFVPPRPEEDGHYHTITIKLSRPGLHLSFRPGYNDEQPHPPDPALIHEMIQGPMRLGALPSTQILFDLHVQPDSASESPKPAESVVSIPAIPHKKGTTPYTTLFTFDPTQLTLSEAPDGTRAANIELDLGAFDFYGKLVAARSQTFEFTVTPAQYASFYRKPLNLSLAIDLPHGQLTLHAGVFDTAANKAGTLEIPLTVPKKGAP